MLQVILQNATLIFAVLFGISEAIGMIPQVKASGVFQAVWNVLVFVKEKVIPVLPKSQQ